MKPDITIIIVSTNDATLLKRCLLSISKTKKKLRVEIIIVNNASNDKTEQCVKEHEHLQHIHVIRNKKRKGFSFNNNQAIKIARADYILLLNPDTQLLPESLQRLLSFIKTHKRVGICAPKLLNPNMSLQYSCRRFPTWKTYIFRRTPFRYFFPMNKTIDFHLMKNENHNIQLPVDWILGGCMCIRKKMTDTIGLLDEKFFLYVDDIDYCLRAWKAHWSVYYVPSARVIHLHQARSDKSLFNVYSFYHIRSMIYFVLKHGLFPRR